MQVTFDNDARFRGLINNVPDWPKKGVVFRDINPLLADPDTYRFSIECMDEWARANCPTDLKGVVSIESRGHLFGAPLACSLGVGLAMARKGGKLPGDVATQTYNLEYGQATLELARSAIVRGGSYLIVDDVLATGGTVAAVAQLLRSLGATAAGCVTLVELAFLKPRDNLPLMKIGSLVTYRSPT